jgi:hypothetical protein
VQRVASQLNISNPQQGFNTNAHCPCKCHNTQHSTESAARLAPPTFHRLRFAVTVRPLSASES